LSDRIEVQEIHDCKNDCIMFHGENVEEEYFPKCGTSRYKQITDKGDDGEEMCHKVPRKVCWYFPIIPCVKCLFATSKDAQLLSWHSDG